MDLGLPDGSGIELIPHFEQGGTKVVVLSVFGNEEHVLTAIRAGAHGYLLKGSGDPMIAVRDVMAGHTPLTPSVATYILAELKLATRTSTPRDDLSRRERDALMALSRGLTYKEFAQEMGVSFHTVSDHLKSIYRKLGVTSRNQAVLKGFVRE